MNFLRRPFALLLVLVLLPFSSIALAACGSDESSSDAAAVTATPEPTKAEKASKVEIALRLGLAYGAFKRYVYKPAQAGTFKKGAPKRKRAIAKAAVASAFTARMLQKAVEEAKQDPNLADLVTQIGTSAGSIGALTSILKDGDVDLNDVTGGLSSLDGLFGIAKDLGIDAQEKNVGFADLLAG
jgi:hypothetical protein